MIRRHAGQDALEMTVGQVGLVPGSVELDVDRLEQLAAAADWVAASELVAGEFLEGFGVPDATEFEDWLAAEREQWRGRSVEVLVRCADHLTRVARAQDGAAVAGRALAIEPTSESALRAALRARSLAGDRAGALELAERFHARLAELGVQPAAETRAMVERVRRERGVRREVQTDSADDLAAVRPPLGRAGRGAGPPARPGGALRPHGAVGAGPAGGRARCRQEPAARRGARPAPARRHRGRGRTGGRGRSRRSVERRAGARARRPDRRPGRRPPRHRRRSPRWRRPCRSGPSASGAPDRATRSRSAAPSRNRCARRQASSRWCSR